MFWFDVNWELQQVLNPYWSFINIGLIAYCFVVFYATLRRPTLGLTLVAAVLPTYLIRSLIGGIPFTVLELCIIAATLGWLVRQWHHGFRHVFTALTGYRIGLILIITGATIGVFLSPDIRAAIGLWKAYVIEPIIFFVLLKTSLETNSDKRRIVIGLQIGAFAVAALALYQAFTGFAIAEPGWVAEAHRRVTSFYTSPNAVGLLLGPIIILTFGLLLHEWKQSRLRAGLLGLLIIVELAGLVGTRSAGTFLGLLAAVFVFGIIWNWRITLGAAIIGAIASLGIPALREKIIDAALLHDASGKNRLTLLEMASGIFTSRPLTMLTGAGILGFAAVQNALRNPLVLEPLLYPHTIILNFWFEFGLLGLIGFLLTFYSFYKHGIQKIRSRRDWFTVGVLAAMTAVIVHGMVDVPYFKNDLAVLFWIIVALV